MEEGTEGAVTGAYVRKLRTGKARDPGYRVLAALSRFFDVPVTYFFSEGDIPQEKEYVYDLDEAVRQDILSMIEYIRQARGLLDDEENTTPQAEER